MPDVEAKYPRERLLLYSPPRDDKLRESGNKRAQCIIVDFYRF